MKIVYRGPGDAVELDGLSFKKGETAEVTREQYERILASDDAAVVDVLSAKADTLDDALRIRTAQGKQRDRATAAAAAEEKRRAAEREKADKEEADRATAAAAKVGDR